MKKAIFPLLIVSLLMIKTTNSFAQKTDRKSERARTKLRVAKEDVATAKADLKEAQKDSINEYEKFKKESDDNIADHAKAMIAFEERLKNIKSNKKGKYEKRLINLKLRNSDLQMRIDNYKYDSHYNWSVFKIKFSHDMKALGKQIVDLLNEK